MKAFSMLEGVIVASLVSALGLVGVHSLSGVEEGASSSLQEITDHRLEHSGELHSLLDEDLGDISCSVN